MKQIIILMLFLSSLVVAQNSGSNMSSFIIKEKLDYRDPVDLELGRYESYEINIGKGDNLAVELKSEDFWPVLLLMSPSKKSILKFPTSQKNVVRFDTTITEGGAWELYVIGDTNTVGTYSCEIGFADSSALNSKINDVCSGIKYFVTHAHANFIFVRNNPQSVVSNLFDELKFSNGNAEFRLVNEQEKAFNKLAAEIKNCLGEKWLEDEEKSDSNTKYFIENVFKNRVIVKLSNTNGKFYISIEKE